MKNAAPSKPMSLGNMRSNGVRSVIAECLDCRHQADFNADILLETTYVPDVERRLVCSRCGSKRITTRPAWHEATFQGMAR